MFTIQSLNDAWFMNESLAFYISTNTFRNPIFDADNINDSNQENSHKQNSTLNPNETNLMQCRNDDNYATRSQQPDAKNNNNKLFTGRRRLSNICDNFAFAIKCKAFVWELNLKRKLKDLRKFCDKNLPKVFHDQLFHQQHADRDSIHTHRKPNGRPRRKLDKYISSFWHEIEPDSPESLNKQQGRLLSRLEKAKRDSQKLFNMEKFENHYGDLDDQSYHGGQTRNNNGYNSGLNLFETRYVRPTEKQQSPSEMARVGSVLNTIRPAPRAAKFGAGLMESAASGWNNKVTGQSNDASNEKQSATMTMTTTPSRCGKRRSCWFLRGRQIKDETHVFTSSKKLCIVCYTNVPNIVTLPCKHHDICSDCFIEIIYMTVKNSQYPLKCVLCRQKVERIRCSRRLLLSVIDKNRTKL